MLRFSQISTAMLSTEPCNEFSSCSVIQLDHFVFDVPYDLQRLMMMIVGLVWFLVVVHAEFVSTDDGLWSSTTD